MSVALASSLLLLVAPTARAAEPPITSTGQNLPSLTGRSSYQAGPGPAVEIRRYQASGDWDRDRISITAAATTFLDDWAAECRTHSDCRPAAVFDIDETLLSSYSTFNRHDFAPTAAQRSTAQNRCQQARIASVAALYAHARDLGVDIFIVTGRSASARSATARCLRARGITGWTRLMMRAPDQRAALAAGYKAAARRSIEQDGYDIALSIGDQFSDVTGGHFVHGFVLPNPMSFIA